MQRAIISSSNLKDCGWGLGPVVLATSDADAPALFVRFHKGAVYRYEGVPHSVFAALAGAESCGQFFNRFVRTAYPYSVLETDPFDVDADMLVA